MAASGLPGHPYGRPADPGARRPAAAVSAPAVGTADRSALWVGLGVAVAVLLCFASALRCDFIVNWDDDTNILNNPQFRGLSMAHLRWMFTTFHGGHYQPLSWITLAIDYMLWGLQPRGYHLTNVLLHTANALLVYVLACRLLARAAAVPRVGRGLARSSAAAVAALTFAIHPLRVESVVWVTERRDVLSAGFLLLTVVAYLRMVDALPAPRWRPWFILSLACFVLSLLSKAWGMTLPIVLLVLDIYPLRRFGSDGARRRLWLEKIPFLVLAAAAMVLAAAAQLTVSEWRTLGQHGVLARAMQAAYGLLFYLRKTLLPVNLSPLYPLRPDFDPTAARYLIAAFAVLAVTLIAIRVRQRWPWALAAWACYVVILAPVLGVLQTGPQLVADRYTYIACLPWALLAGAAVYTWPTLQRPAGSGVIAALLLLLGTLTVRQVGVWSNAFTLWDHALRIEPSNYVAAVNRGWLQVQRGDADGALRYYDDAVRANPRLAIAYRGRGAAHYQRGDLQGAIADYSAALELEPLAATYFNRGLARHALGDNDAALADYSEALRLDSTNPQAFNNRGMLRRERGDLRGAISDLHQALDVAPADWPYRAQTERNLKATEGLRDGD